MSELYRPKIAILASGSGSTAEAFIRATQDGRVNAKVSLVICNNPPEKAGIYSRITRLNKKYGIDIKTVQINGQTHPGGKVDRGQTLDESKAICERLKKGGITHVALMGYMKQVRGALVEEYGWRSDYTSIYQARMTNTHPGPLPETEDTYGLNTSQKVLDLGMNESRHTVHLVSDGIDAGPVIAEHPVEVLEGDTAQNLFDRVQIVEKVALPYVIGKFLREQKDYLEK